MKMKLVGTVPTTVPHWDLQICFGDDNDHHSYLALLTQIECKTEMHHVSAAARGHFALKL